MRRNEPRKPPPGDRLAPRQRQERARRERRRLRRVAARGHHDVPRGRLQRVRREKGGQAQESLRRHARRRGVGEADPHLPSRSHQPRRSEDRHWPLPRPRRGRRRRLGQVQRRLGQRGQQHRRRRHIDRVGLDARLHRLVADRADQHQVLAAEHRADRHRGGLEGRGLDRARDLAARAGGAAAAHAGDAEAAAADRPGPSLRQVWRARRAARRPRRHAQARRAAACG